MCDEPMRFRLFGFNSGFSGSDDVDEVAVDGIGMDADVEGPTVGKGAFDFFRGALYACGRYWMFLLLFNANSTEAITRENA